MSKFDVWIIRFEPGDASPAERLQAAFGIDAAAARALEQSVPKVVKHAVAAKAAGEMRLALEAIGAVVECRPARDVKPVAGSGRRNSAAVFHPPGADLFPAGRVSAIDPFASSSHAGVPRISVDEAIPPGSASGSPSASEAELPEERIASPSFSPPEQWPSRRARRALAGVVAGIAILAIAWGLSSWRKNAITSALDAARRGDRGAAEPWVDRALRQKNCELHEAGEYLDSPATRQYVRRPDYVEDFVEKLYLGGAPEIEICDSDVLGYRFAHYLLVTLPDDPSKQETVIADAQSLVRRDAVVYRGVTSAEVEEIVRASTLIGEHRVLVDLPAEAD